MRKKGPRIGDVRLRNDKVYMIIGIVISNGTHIYEEEVKHSLACERGWINESALSCLACHLEAKLKI